MKKINFLFAAIILVALSVTVFGQEFEIKQYEIDVKIVPEQLKADVRTKLRMVNLSGPDLADKILLSTDRKPRMSFFINLKAVVNTVSLNGSGVKFTTSEDVRNNLLRIYADINSEVASAREFDIEFGYSIQSADRSPALHISADDTYLLPSSFWVPVVHTPYAEHGADTAPFKLTVMAPAGLKVISSGIRKSENSFEQSMAAQPFVIVGDYDVITRGGETYPVEIYMPRGLTDAGREQAQRLAVEAEKIMVFDVKYFNVAALAPFRVISSQARQLNTATSDTFSAGRETTFSTVGAVTVDDNLFRRDALDLGTIELLASAAARGWIDGHVLLRGRGTGVLRDGLPIYLAALYLGERFGRQSGDEAFDRYRQAYATIARSDAPLLMQSQLDRNYKTSVYNKGALIWRMIEKKIGAEVFQKVLRDSLTRTRVDVLSLNEWSSPLCGISRCTTLKNNLMAGGGDRKLIDEIFSNGIDTVVLPDFAIGQPQSGPGGVESTIANFGTGDATVDVVAVTESGQRIDKSVTVKASEYGTVTFPAGTRIARIEVDPEKLYIQADYANDVFPRKPSEFEAFGQANLAFSKKEYATAETKAREAVAINPKASTLQALLGRILLAQNKYDEAAKVLGDVLKAEPVQIQAYGWAHLGLGEIALQKNQAAEAARHFNLAAAADLDAATTIEARDGALKAEKIAGAASVPEDIKAFLTRLDGAILTSTSDSVNPLVDLSNLRRFAQSLVVRKPAIWVTEALRVEPWDANRTSVDVTLKIKIEGKDYSGRAIYVVNRSGGKVMLSEVPVFDVK